MKANLEQLEEMQKELFRQQCDLDIQKAMVKHFIKMEKPRGITITNVDKKKQCDIHVVTNCYTEKDVDNAYDKGFKDGNQRYLTGSLTDVVGQSEQCTHENEVQRQGDGFIYTVCGDCGEDLD